MGANRVSLKFSLNFMRSRKGKGVQGAVYINITRKYNYNDAEASRSRKASRRLNEESETDPVEKERRVR